MNSSPLIFTDDPEEAGSGGQPSWQRREERFVANSLVDHSNHGGGHRKFLDQFSYSGPRRSNMSDGDHREYSGLYSEGGLLGDWRPPPDPAIAAARRRKRLCIKALAFFLLVVGCLVLAATVGAPVVVQQSIDDSTFAFTTAINMTDPDTSGFHLTAGAEVKASAPADATVRGAPGKRANIYFYESAEETWRKFGETSLPDIKLSAGKDRTAHLNFRSEKVHVTDQGAWKAFMLETMNSRTFRMKFEGEVEVAVDGWLGWAGIVYGGLSMTKVVTLDGMDGLKGLKVLDYDAVDSPDSGYLGLDTLPTQVATVRIPNYSSLNVLNLGQLCADTLYEGSSMGWARTVGNVSLLQGDNTVTLLGPLAPQNMTLFDEVMSRFLTGEKSLIHLLLANHSFVPNVTEATAQYGPPDETVHWPASSEPLFSPALQDYALAVELRWPGGGRVNLTTETIIDLADAPLVPVPDFGIGLPLWVGFANPFSANVVVIGSDFDVFWDPNTAISDDVGSPAAGITATQASAAGGAAAATATTAATATAAAAAAVAAVAADDPLPRRGAGRAAGPTDKGPTDKGPPRAAAAAGDPLGNGEFVAWAYNPSTFIPLAPREQILTGETYNTSMRVYSKATNLNSVAMLAEMRNETGWVFVGLRGSFHLRCGSLDLTLSYFQSIDIPNCALAYAQTHPKGGACRHPPAWNISGIPHPPPTAHPTPGPTALPSEAPSAAPSARPVPAPPAAPELDPTAAPVQAPTGAPSSGQSASPSSAQTAAPTVAPGPRFTTRPTVLST